MVNVEQGDILKVESLNGMFLVVSNNYFNNKEDMAFLCPLVSRASTHPLHINVTDTTDHDWLVLSEQAKLIDLRKRGYSIVSRIKIDDIINITDAIQGIFDY